MSEYVSTREVAERLGYRQLSHLRKALRALELHPHRLGPKGRIRWKWSEVERAFHGKQASTSGQSESLRQVPS